VHSIVRASFDEAERRRTAWVGFDHLLAAVASDPQESRAREALRASGLDEPTVSGYVPHVEHYVPPIQPLDEGERPLRTPTGID
jgi:hypothetical protein